MIDILIQVALAVCGVGSYAMAVSSSERLRFWSPYLGLAGQPLWGASAIGYGNWGMLVVTILFTAVYARTIIINFRTTR